MHPTVYNDIIYNCQDMEETEMLINRWMNKDYVHTHPHLNTIQGLRNNEILLSATTQMTDLEGIMLNEIS